MTSEMLYYRLPDAKAQAVDEELNRAEALSKTTLNSAPRWTTTSTNALDNAYEALRRYAKEQEQKE